MNRLTLEKANAIIEAGFIESMKLSLQPMSIAILDAGGHLIAFQRQDKAAILRFDIAFAKAYGALGMGIGSRGLAIKANEIPGLMEGAIIASKGRLIPAPGGVLIVNIDNEIIGAAGASGDTSDNDEHSVISGILSVGLIPKTS
ncbi:MAG: heme-binding protein [Legionella sp.]|nr:heme-binding protein [Legionella sp.]